MKFKNPASIHPPLATYSHQAFIPSCNPILLMSGQIGMDKLGNVPEDPLEQLTIALENVKHNLTDANMNINHIVKLTFYFVGAHEVKQREEIISNYLGNHRPCMTVLFVAALADPFLKVEVEACASISS